MKVTECAPFDELFTHFDEQGVQTDWNATKLYEWITSLGEAADKWKFAVPVEEQHATFCVQERGVEEHRLARLFEHPDRLKKPIVFVEMEDGTHLLVDGTHRYVAYFALKAPTIPSYIVPFQFAKPFIVDGMPAVDEQRLKNSWSGL